MDMMPSGGSLDYNSVSKFYGDQSSQYGGKLHWPGVGGFPYRGDKVPLLTEADHHKCYVAGDANHGKFDLSDPQESTTYAWIRDRIINGLFRQDYIHREWNAEKQNMIIYLEWTQLYTQMRGQ
jgi:hypothetical protein